ncbi:MAG: hypothetical protein HGA23_05740, partial [Bacteroidales bacterium]|nr:hypothetical protein [Bacteroidales bacterium]
MMKTIKVISALPLLTVIIMLVAVTGCNKDEFNGRQASYSLMVEDVLGVSGTATFNETSTTSTNIDLVLINAPSGTHPAELRM